MQPPEKNAKISEEDAPYQQQPYKWDVYSFGVVLGVRGRARVRVWVSVRLR